MLYKRREAKNIPRPLSLPELPPGGGFQGSFADFGLSRAALWCNNY
ncbi:hypothetical protein DCCM_3198 [Desulfocucumis palustris]|uniref:Uncharacterized protein n=1 Tax=Desulfocucumis palustris TaxID=1898651 RepID=A0A2L2XIM3_9FIRM|nr:hypothetical protein DCCM_3198 [Desulfocucumis palustris]